MRGMKFALTFLHVQSRGSTVEHPVSIMEAIATNRGLTVDFPR